MDRLAMALLALALLLAATAGSAEPVEHDSSVIEYVPASLLGYRGAGHTIEESAAGRPFRQCADCPCCDPKNPSDCKTMKCCYGIVCNKPGKPFGSCSLTPLVCNCDNCQ